MTAEHDQAVKGDAEAIHRLRVATRRLRASLRMLREVAPNDDVESVADELGWLCGVIGAVRDLDVLAELLQERATHLEPDFIRALEPLSVTLRQQRATEQERLVAALDSERYRGLVQRLGTLTPEQATEPVALGTMAARLVRSQLRATLRAGAGLDDSSPADALHRLRIRVKKLRYAIEPLRAVGGKPTRKMLRRLERVQERLGQYHDAVSAAEWLRGWASDPQDAPPAALMAVGALIHSFERRVRRLRDRSLKAWRRAEMDGLARGVLHELNFVAAEARRNAKPPLALAPVIHAS